MIDELTNARINALADAFDELAVKHAALTAVLGAIVEKYPVDLDRVDAWCRAIAAQSDRERGVGQTATQRAAHDHRDHLVLRMAAAHAFAPHPAIGGDHHPSGRDVFQRLADDLADLIRPLNLQSVMIDDADHDLLVGHCPADRFEIRMRCWGT